MSTTTHQGAVGAETMTAGQIMTLEKALAYMTPHPTNKGTILLQGITARQAMEVIRAALSAPAPRTDGGMTAGEVLRAILLRAKWIGQKTTAEDYAARVVFDTQEEAYEAYRALVALRDATPAQPAGAVPDSLRALSEALAEAAAASQRAIETYNAKGTQADKGAFFAARQKLHETDAAYRNAKDALADQCLALLASHPAGQSAGSGAEQRRALERMATDIDHAAEGKPLIRAQADRLRMAAHLLREQARLPAPNSTRTGAEAMREAAASICDEQQELCSKNAGKCDEDGERQWSLAATCLRDAARAIRRLPAPNSTRTGQGEAEETRRKEVDRIVSALRRLAGSKVIVRAEDQDAILGAADVLDEYQSEAAAIVECRGLRWSAWSEDDADSIATDPLVGYSTDWYVGVYADEDPDPIFRIMVGGDKRAELLARKVAAALNDGAPCPALARAPAVEGSGSPMANLKREVVALRAQARSNLAFYEEHGSDIALLESQRVAAFEEVLALLAARPAAPEAQGIVWHQPEETPEVGRKVVQLYEDGSGAVLLYQHDCGQIDCEGDDLVFNKAFPPGIWAYLPDDFRFWCEDRAEDPLNLPAPPASSGQGGR